jgi:endonuclease/exonuclease/phosphatase family metal-dependent hydrolase
MVWYTDLRNPRLFTSAERDWTSRRLLDLRAQLASAPPKGVPRRTKKSSLIIGTWNIRDFDNNKFRHGPRRRESLYYIAEILSAFDVCAIQEINEDLTPLKDVIRLMGPGWDFIATDVTVGNSGNRERMAFVFDSRKVRFRNIAGEIVLPKHALLPGEQQFARTPFLVSFQAGWFKFSLCTVHIYFGEEGKGSDGYQRRVQEIEYLAKEMAGRADRENENYILLGDFNIKNPIDETMQALTKAGFQLPPEQYPSNLLGTNYYDQIAFRTRPDELTFLSSGAFDWSQSVFRPEHYEHYAPALPARHRDLGEDGAPRDKSKDKEYYSKRWLTWQMSDHLPLWVELAVDFSDAHLLNNLDPAFETAGAPAQIETTGDDPAAADTPPELPAPLQGKSKRRKAPKIAPPEKKGTLAPAPRMTFAEGWRIFWWVAGGGMDRMRKAREAHKTADKPRKAKPAKR